MGNAGGAFIDPAAAAAAGAAGPVDMGELESSEQEPSSEGDDGDPEHHHHHHHEFEDELLAAEEEMHMMQAQMDGHAQEVRRPASCTAGPAALQVQAQWQKLQESPACFSYTSGAALTV